MSSGQAPNAPDSIVFLGDTKTTYAIENLDIPTSNNFTEVYLTGGQSLYVVYDVIDLSHRVTPDRVQFVTSTTQVKLDFVPRSTKGHSKEGIILFETFNYGGTSQCYIDNVNDLTSRFPPGSAGGGLGISSFIVNSGKWQLFKDINQGGGPIRVNGKDTFGKGDFVDLQGHLSLNDSIKSIKNVEDI